MVFGGSAYWAGALLAVGAALLGGGALLAGAALLAGSALEAAAALLAAEDAAGADGAWVTGSARPGSVAADDDVVAGALDDVSVCIWLKASRTVEGCEPVLVAWSRMVSVPR